MCWPCNVRALKFAGELAEAKAPAHDGASERPRGELAKVAAAVTRSAIGKKNAVDRKIGSSRG